MKCLVLGGGGFIGSSLVDRLLLDGHRVRVLARSGCPPYRDLGAQESVEWLSGDFLNVEDLHRSVKGMDAVFHLVSSTVPKSANADPVLDMNSNLFGTLQLLRVIGECPVGRIIFISSGGTVYGSPCYLPIDESHPTDPLTAYGITKLSIEKHLQIFSRMHGIPAFILRTSNAYGDRQRLDKGQGALSIFLHRASLGQPVEIWGSGEITRDYIHVSDVAEALARIVTYGGEHRIFNVGTGVGTSLDRLVELIGTALGKPVETSFHSKRGFDVSVNILDNSRIRNSLDWVPGVDIQEGIARTLTWMRNREAGGAAR